jgi:transcriptional regulator with AAA-type ATPase domain
MRVLLGYNWPGNVTELRDVLRAALTRRPAGDLREADLPEKCFASSRRSLTPMEIVERDAIVRALVEAGGNRVKATGILGIARSSLYRKIDANGTPWRRGVQSQAALSAIACGIFAAIRAGRPYAGPIPAAAGGVLAAIKARRQCIEVGDERWGQPVAVGSC